MKLQPQRAAFRFYAQLNDFLSPGRKGSSFEHFFELGGTIKDMIEALGVPHTEVALILANGTSVDFSYRVLNGDRVSVYPPFRTIDITPLLKFQPYRMGDPRFVADTHLGRLAAYLRMLGFDTSYRNDYSDDELVEISNLEDRMLLTRDLGILKRSAVRHGYFVRGTTPREQVIDVLARLDLFKAVVPFRRCMRCNEPLQPTTKERVADRLPPWVRQLYSEFNLCPSCGRIYWQGTHYTKMRQKIQLLLAGQPSPVSRI